jgi:hypothetical protein
MVLVDGGEGEDRTHVGCVVVVWLGKGLFGRGEIEGNSKKGLEA